MTALFRRLSKLRGLPPAELLRVLEFKAGRTRRAVAQGLRVRALRRVWPGMGLPLCHGLREDIVFFGVADWRGDPTQLSQAVRLGGERRPEEILRQAADASAHVFDLLGSGPVDLGETIDWHRDFKSGARWEPRYFKRIKEIELGDSSDIKVPWELSRCYHFVTLGLAYHLAGHERYAREFTAQCLDWIERNPPYHGVNWHCAMEVAIRAINWTWAYFLFRESASFDPAARRRLASALAVHGEYIWNNLEFDKRVLGGRYVRHNGNHYVADLVGLIYLGLVLPGRRAARWLTWALPELDRELQEQVLPDGAHWELSPSYHRLVMELVLPAVILCEQNRIPVVQTLRRACEAMADYTLHYLRPDGRCPLVRDADNGRVCLLDGGDYRDHRHLLALAGTYFRRPDFVSRAGRVSGEVVWILGRAGVERARRLLASPPRLPSKGFSAAGFYVLRDGDRLHVFVACADVGMKGTYGGHAHNDCLSFELYCDGASFITDCGTYIYSGDPSARNQFRSTASHNTARVDGQEMNRFAETELFGMENDARPKVLAWRTEPDADCLVAEHYGYSRLEPPVVHRRSFRLDRSAGLLLLEDRFEGGGEHLFELFFHFCPGVQVELVGELACRAVAGGSMILCSFSGGLGWTARIEPTWVSERYGRRDTAWKLALVSRQPAPATLTTRIQYGAGCERPRTEPLAESLGAASPEALSAS